MYMRFHPQSIINHYKAFFRGHDATIETREPGPLKKRIPNFQVIRFSPGPTFDLWVYCSIGASTIRHENSGPHEFLVTSPIESQRHVETLAMVTYYHSDFNLTFGHSIPIGEPWLPQSKCKNWLVSLPYPFGQKLELMPINDTHAHVAWLLPITDEEREYLSQHGLEALEQQFDDSGLEYWDIDRDSVV